MVEVECDNCGKIVDKKPAKVERNDHNFCSQECYHEFGRPDMRGKNNPTNPAKEMVSLTCEICGEEFEVHPYRGDSARFCSKECSNKYMEGLTGEKSPRYKGAKETYVCDNCGEEFEEYPYRNDRRFCSVSCYREAAKEMFKGENNPVWRGGYERYYGPNWQEQREKVLERDDYTCQDCGKHASDMHNSPDIHHIKRIGWFREEYDAPEWWEKANRVDNLVTLCSSCHKKREWSKADT